MQPDDLDLHTILTRARESRQRFDAVLANFDDDQMIVTHDPEGWSLKDVMAHITFWESYALTRLQEATHGCTPELYGDISEAQLNAINQDALEAGRGRSLDQVKDDFAHIRRELLDAIQGVPADEDDPWWALWPEPNTPKRLIAYNTWDHYDEHLADVQKWQAT